MAVCNRHNEGECTDYRDISLYDRRVTVTADAPRYGNAKKNAEDKTYLNLITVCSPLIKYLLSNYFQLIYFKNNF